MRNNSPQLLRGLAVFMAFLAGMFLVLAAGGASMALAQHGNSSGNVAIYAPLDDGTPEATETEHAPEATETEHPRETQTHEVEPTETHEVEPTETHEVEPTETEHDPEATETHEPDGTRTPEATETEHDPEGTETPEAEPSRTHEVEPSETAEPIRTGTPSVEPTETEPLPTTTVTPGASSGVPGTGTRFFPQTGKSVNGVFLQYWDRNGGLMQQGYPISAPGTEVSTLNGKTYTVQYFERSVFEMHPENQAPYNVLLSQLGTYRYNQKYPNGAPNQVANRTNAHYFAETKHWVGGEFWSYWQSHGGLMQQGYPISDQFQEKSDLDGKTYTVQYFERAVFELHPENKAPYNVLLSQLGTFQYDQKYGHR